MIAAAAEAVAVYVVWALTILAAVIGIAAAVFSRRPDLAERMPWGAGSREEPLPAPPATTRSDGWAWPVRGPEFDPASYVADRDRLLAVRREWENGGVVGTASRPVVVEVTPLPSAGPTDVEVRGPGSWDPEAFRGSLAEKAVDRVWAQIEADAKGGPS